MNVTDLFGNRPGEQERTLSRLSAEGSEPMTVALNREHSLQLHGEDRLLHSFVCSPGELGELCVGWLTAEGYRAETVEISADGDTALAKGISAIPQQLCEKGKNRTTTAEMLALFHAASETYARTHGVHECVLKGDGWHILCTDIGRHNAIDKAVGAAVLAGYDLQGAVMFTSGRINLQTVQKAVRCGIGCLMSKAVITAEALELAKKLGLEVLFSVTENSHIV